jgi:hypothetical protein
MASPEANKAVARFLDAVGIAMIAAGFEWLIFVDHPSPIVVGGFWLGGSAVFFAGAFWERAQSYVPERVIQSLEVVASDVRYWLAFVLVAWLSLLFLTTVQKMRVNDTLSAINENIGSLRADMKQIHADFNCYVKPRHLKPEQIKAVAQYLSTHEPHEISLKVVANDGEASAFSSDLATAFQQGGWTIISDNIDSNPCIGGSELRGGFAQVSVYCLSPSTSVGVLCTQQPTANSNSLGAPAASPTPAAPSLLCSRVAEKGVIPEGGTGPCSPWACFTAKGAGDGLFTWQQVATPAQQTEGLQTQFMQTREHSQTPEDPKHPNAQTLLTEVFRLANVQSDGGSSGGGGNIAKDSLSIVIGHRRRDGQGQGCPQTIIKEETVPAPE